jgi:hypothetical protein
MDGTLYKVRSNARRNDIEVMHKEGVPTTGGDCCEEKAVREATGMPGG